MGSVIQKRQFSIQPDAAIRDNQTTTSTIVVEDEGIVREIKVKLELNHTYLHDLVMTLTDPDGSREIIYDRDRIAERHGAENKLEFNVGNKPMLKTFIGKKCKGNWTLTIEDRQSGDQGALKGWSLELGTADLSINGLRIENSGYVSIDHKHYYEFQKGAFSVMAFICLKKLVNGQTEMTKGTIFSSKPSVNAGGWELKIRKDNEVHLLCFHTWDNLGCYHLCAPIDNLYDDKRERLARVEGASEADKTKAEALFKEYTHYVGATRGTDGTLCLYVNGYLLAKVTPKNTSSGNGVDGFRLTGMFKETIDKPTHYFSLDREPGSNYKVGVADWDSDEFHIKGSAFSLSSVEEKTISLSSPENSVSAIHAYSSDAKWQKIRTLSVTPVGKGKKLLAEFIASRPSPLDVSVNNTIGLSIGRTEKMADPYEGFVKHVSLWKTALSQADIISYMDKVKLESDSPDCVGFWKLEGDYNDYSSNGNHGNGYGSLSPIHQHQVLPLYMEEQQKTNWCWAATALSIIEFYNPLSKTSQSEIVTERYGSTVNNPGSTSYYLGKASNHMRARYVCNSEHLGNGRFVYGGANNELNFDYLTSEIDNWNPVCVSVKWKDGPSGRYLNIGHIMTLSGVQDQDQMLIINDPWSGLVFIKYVDFVSGRYPGNGTWYAAIPTSANKNIIHANEDWKIENGGYKLTFQNDGNFCVYQNGRYVTGTLTGRDYFKVSSLEFRLNGTLLINTQDDAKKQIVLENPTPDYRPRPPYKLDLDVSGDNWDVVVKDNSNTKLYSIKQEFGAS